MQTTIMRTILAAAAATLLLAASGAGAAICGDPTGDGAITVTDGVQILRAAAALPSSCTPEVCDVDGTGTTTVTDGVSVLRRAAQLPSVGITCGTGTGNFVSGVETGGGQAVLEIGAALIPGQGAPSTIQEITGNQSVIGGGSNQVDVAFDTGTEAGVTQATPPIFILAIANSQGEFFTGYYVIPLDAAAGIQSLTLTFPSNLSDQTFLLCPATIVNGQLSQYGVYEQRPIATAGGQLQVTLSFSPSQDLDLHLVEPSGFEIYYGSRVSPAGGRLDLDSNPDCSPIDGINNEKITYGDVTPPAGEYIVRVDYYESCDGGGADYTVVITKNGVQQTIEGSFTSSEADFGGLGSGREVARFTFP